MSKVVIEGEHCRYCLERAASLLVCSRCKVVSYCSSTCQKTDWPTHKPYCRADGPAALTKMAITRFLSDPSKGQLQFIIAIAYYAQEVATDDEGKSVTVHLDLANALRGQWSGWIRREAEETKLTEKDPHSVYIRFSFDIGGQQHGGFITFDNATARGCYLNFSKSIPDLTMFDRAIMIDGMTCVLNGEDPNKDNWRVVRFNTKTEQ